jgi:hypothetical protein
MPRGLNLNAAFVRRLDLIALEVGPRRFGKLGREVQSGNWRFLLDYQG